jgi:cell division septum initiation protein DivIVA
VVLRRRLFGFNAQQVQTLLADREVALTGALQRGEAMERELADARQQLQAAERQVQEVQARAVAAEQRLQSLEAELASSREQLAQASEQAAPAAPGKLTDPLMGLLVHGLAPIIDSARESAAAMLEEATKLSEQRVGEAEDVMRMLREQGRSMSSWWHGVHGMVEPMVSTLDQARARMDEVPARVQQALTPLGELMGAVKDQLEVLAKVSEPPSFPSTEEEQGAVVDLTTEGEGSAPEPDREAGPNPAMGYRRGSHSWWPEVSPSANSVGL